jgi:hypothetical protein
LFGNIGRVPRLEPSFIGKTKPDAFGELLGMALVDYERDWVSLAESRFENSEDEGVRGPIVGKNKRLKFVEAGQ